MWPSNTEHAGNRLRELIEEQRPLLVPGVHDAMSAKVVEFVGFSSVYCSSLGTALSLLGLPDTGLATATEIVLAARYIADAVSIPLIADAGNGFGDVSNVMRTTHDFIKAGVGAIHLDDQQSPSQ